MLRRPRKFEDILTIDEVFRQNLKGPLKILAKGKAHRVILRFHTCPILSTRFQWTKPGVRRSLVEK